MNKMLSAAIQPPKTGPATEPPYASLGIWRKLWWCLKRAWNDTLSIFAWDPKSLFWPALLLAAGAYRRYPEWSEAASIWEMIGQFLASADLAIGAAAVVFVYELLCAPYRFVRDENGELRAWVDDVETKTRPLLEIGYDPGDCNSKQGNGTVTLSLGGKWQRVNQANLHALRLRCSNPTPQDIHSCSGYVTAVDRATPEGSWETIWHDALNLTWSLTEGETRTTIPAKGKKYLDVAVLSVNDLPVLIAKPQPHDLHGLFHCSGLYRLRGCVSSEGRAAIEFDMTLEYEAATQRVVVKMGETPPPQRFPKVAVAARALS